MTTNFGKTSRTAMALMTAAMLAYAAAPSMAADAMKADVATLPGVAFNQALADKLPAAIKKAGVMKVATDLTPPISFHDADGALIALMPISPPPLAPSLASRSR